MAAEVAVAVAVVGVVEVDHTNFVTYTLFSKMEQHDHAHKRKNFLSTV